ncbi:Hypothetical predicted protein [Mytilus galloprovincialis]|uniref:C-type lectin domain-containing protein n=1 Tax=Mytilus galloprovincialis TaxID=29158 RepID=A0A8B6GRZ6_MYTGA|nr:Hypothetical predicted protein [Mytilus galloprovincialis]
MDQAVIKDLETQNEVQNFLTTSTSGSISRIWIGLFWSSRDLSFKWVDNETQGSWSNWDAGEPNCMELTEEFCPALYDQNCIRMQLTANLWFWKTHGCYNQYSVLCQSCTDTTIVSSTSANTMESSTTRIAYSSPNTSSNKLSTNGGTETAAVTFIDKDSPTTEGYIETSKNQITDYDTKPQTGHHASSSKPTTRTLNTSTIGKDDCKSKSNGCQCQKIMSNTTESVKMSDYIWIRKCEVQTLIDSGVLKVIDCPYTCTCSSRDTNEANSATHEMFVCIKRR